jgi:hypothetical protein
MPYIVQEATLGVFTVGFTDESGKWKPVSDTTDAQAAMREVSLRNKIDQQSAEADRIESAVRDSLKTIQSWKMDDVDRGAAAAFRDVLTIIADGPNGSALKPYGVTNGHETRISESP